MLSWWFPWRISPTHPPSSHLPIDPFGSLCRPIPRRTAGPFPYQHPAHGEPWEAKRMRSEQCQVLILSHHGIRLYPAQRCSWAQLGRKGHEQEKRCRTFCSQMTWHCKWKVLSDTQNNLLEPRTETHWTCLPTMLEGVLQAETKWVHKTHWWK